MRSRYNYVFDSLTSTYNFATKHNVLYRVAFVVDHTFSTISGEDITNVYQLIIEKASDGIEPLDLRVSWTVGHIVKQFFEEVKNSLVYVCSDMDNKASIRLDTFDRWYRRSDANEMIVKLDKVIAITGQKETHTIYTSFMFHKSNPNRKKLLAIYESIEQYLNDEK